VKRIGDAYTPQRMVGFNGTGPYGERKETALNFYPKNWTSAVK
jgi:hypothetical protein